MKKLNILIDKISLVKGFVTAVIAVAIFYMAAFTALAAEGTVTAETVKIRKETSTDSEVVGSTVKGKKIDILEAVRDSSGMVWYKVAISGGGYGYIRSDCVSTSETIQVSESTSAASNNTGTTAKPAETVPTSIDAQQAVISAQTNVRVRTGASTQHDTVTSLPNGTSVTLIGEANDSQGKKWYQITCEYNGRNIEGYVLASLTAPSSGGSSSEGSQEGGQGEESPEGGQEEGNPEEGQAEGQEGNPEESAGEAPVQTPVQEHGDYEVVYEMNEAGEYEYFFNDYIAGNQWQVSYLLTSAESITKTQGQIKNGKIIIIVLAAVIVLLFIVITVLLFKLRDSYYEDEDEEEEEEEEEEPVPVKKRVRKYVQEEEDESAPVKKRVKKRMEEEDEPVPMKKKKSASTKAEEYSVKSGRSLSRESGEKELYAAEKKEPAKKTTARRPQNFLVDDDEFEFEFLNMDDKDL